MEGLAYLAVALPPFFIAPISGWLSDTRGPKLPALIGMILVIPPLLLLRIPTGVGVDNPSQEAVLCILVAFVSNSLFNSSNEDVALSFVTAPSIGEISHISAKYGNGKHAQAYALFNMAFSGGFLVGPLWGGFVTERGGWNTMVTSLSGLALLSIGPIFYFQ